MTFAQGLQSIEWYEVPRPPFCLESEVLDNGEVELPFKNLDGTTRVWYLTKKGYEGYLKMMEEAENCDQDMHRIYNYNDFMGYGQLELWRMPFTCGRRCPTRDRPS